MRRVLLYRGAFLFSLLLTAVVCFGQSGPAAPVVAAHTGAQHESFCQVIAIPIKEPTPSLHIAQSSEPFRFKATFTSNVTAAQQVVLQYALDEWQATIRTRGFAAGDYPVAFSFGPLVEQKLAVTTTRFYEVSGNLHSAEIVFQNNGSINWFVDPTPDDDTEFDNTPPAGYDLLTVARHEIAHAIGWVRSPRVIDLLSGNTFDSQRLNIATVGPVELHADAAGHPDDLMLDSLGASARRSIRLYPDGALLARAFHYDITMGFVDNGSAGGLGSANAPWTSIIEALSGMPWGFYDLLMIPGTYHEMVPLVLNQPMTISASRGGDVVIRGP